MEKVSHKNPVTSRLWYHGSMTSRSTWDLWWRSFTGTDFLSTPPCHGYIPIFLHQYPCMSPVLATHSCTTWRFLCVFTCLFLRF